VFDVKFELSKDFWSGLKLTILSIPSMLVGSLVMWLVPNGIGQVIGWLIAIMLFGFMFNNLWKE